MRPTRRRSGWVTLALAAVALAVPAQQRAAFGSDRGGLLLLSAELDGDAVRIRAENRLAGPVEARLVTARGTVATTVVPALERVVVGRVPHTQAGSAEVLATPGDPAATHRDVEYGWPLQGDQVRIGQGWGGRHSHQRPDTLHALDLGTPEGTPVLAARAGIVMQVEEGFDGGGQAAERDMGKANYVRVLHDDGSMALYAHLKRDGALAGVGQRVRRGDRIGISGNTGFSSAPHLHFVVQVNRGGRLESVPFRMFSPRGLLRFTLPR